MEKFVYFASLLFIMFFFHLQSDPYDAGQFCVFFRFIVTHFWQTVTIQFLFFFLILFNKNEFSQMEVLIFD